MQIVFQQKFPLGRFHANPWRAFPFDDPHGEWPPSPWRLLRAILARSYQLERERGESCDEWRKSLVRAFCTSTFRWCLPPFSWRGPGLRQYQPAQFGWFPPNKDKPGNRSYNPTLVNDNFWVIGNSGGNSYSGVIWWAVDGESWSEGELDRLDASLERMVYFGRTEAITEIRRVEELPEGVAINCELERVPSSGSVPVLVPSAEATLEQVQAVTDDPSVSKSTVPPGAHWLYAQRPVRPPAKLPRVRREVRMPTRLVQFAIGSRVNPPKKSVVVLTQRFRGRVIREFLGENWKQASVEQRRMARLLTGKEVDGKPLQDPQHTHARFGIIFDHKTSKAARLLAWRNQPFTDDEQRAILNAAEQEIPLSFAKARSKDPWAIRLVPLDSQVPPPAGFDGQSYRNWHTAVPYVPPRHVYNRQGRTKTGELPEEQLRLELSRQGYDITGLVVEVADQTAEWIRVHRPKRYRNGPTNTERRGYHVSLAFGRPVRGPISLGHSSHFGLGLFIADL